MVPFCNCEIFANCGSPKRKIFSSLKEQKQFYAFPIQQNQVSGYGLNGGNIVDTGRTSLTPKNLLKLLFKCNTVTLELIFLQQLQFFIASMLQNLHRIEFKFFLSHTLKEELQREIQMYFFVAYVAALKHGDSHNFTQPDEFNNPHSYLILVHLKICYHQQQQQIVKTAI